MFAHGRDRGRLTVVATLLVAGVALASCRGDGGADESPSAAASSPAASASPTASPTSSASVAGAGAGCGIVTMPGGDRFRLTVRKGRVACGGARKVYKTYLTKLRRGEAPGNGGGGPVHVQGWTCASGPATDPGSTCTKGEAAFAAKPVAAGATSSSGHATGLSITLTPVTAGRKVKLRVHAVGYAYEPVGADDHKPIPFPDPAKPNILTTVDIHWGDGGTGGANAGMVGCGRPHVLRRVSGTMTLDRHTYRRPGTYHVELTGYGCGLPKKGLTVTTGVTVH